jgi:hypothetical protein
MPPMRKGTHASHHAPNAEEATMTTDTTRRLAEIKERAEKATKGPWIKSDSYTGDEGTFEVGPGEFDTVAHVRQGSDDVPGNAEDNADFFAHSRSDIPFLLAEIERLSVDAARWRYLREYRYYHYSEDFACPQPREFGIEFSHQDSTTNRPSIEDLIDTEIEKLAAQETEETSEDQP